MACTGTNGVVGTAYDALGDGCPISSNAVAAGAAAPDMHDVGVDAQGNVYFIDTQSFGFIRRIDARSGLVTAFLGSPASSQPAAACSTLTDFFGDGCAANDGKGNATPATVGGVTPPYQYTSNFAKFRGIAVAKNGDLYAAAYNGSLIYKVSRATGISTVVAGLLAGGTAAKPAGYKGSQGGYTGDGGSALSAKINSPRGVAVDAANNIYIADSTNNVIRKVTASTGIITTIAGASIIAGSGGDGGPATAASFSTPEDVEVSAAGDVFIGDFGNNKVRVIYEGGAPAAKLISLTNAGTTPTVGDVYTVVGGGAGTYVAGSMVPSTSVPIGNPRKLSLDARGNVYVADNSYNVIWFVDATTGYMRIIAGTYNLTTGGAGCPTQTNTFGDNCPGFDATLISGSDMGVAVDSIGSVYITDNGNHEVRRVSTNQSLPATAAGATASQLLQVHFAVGDGPAALAPFTLAGSADFTISNSSCTVNTDLTRDCLVSVAFTPTKPGPDAATLTIASTLNGSAIIGISGTGTAAAVALDPGATASFATGLKAAAGIAQDAAGNTYIADTGNNRILRYTGPGAMTVIAGTGTSGSSGNGGPAASATLAGPKAVAVSRSGAIFIADTGNNVIRRIDPITGNIALYAGGASANCAATTDTFGDGCLATSAQFSAPAGLAADNDGNVYVADTGNNIIRELTPDGYVVYIGGATAVCGLTGTDKTFGNGCPAAGAVFKAPTGIQVDAKRNLYIADTGNNEVREITAAGIVVNLAGTGAPAASGNGGLATAAQLNGPTGVAVDAGGNIYIADTGNSAIRLVNSLGLINTTVGTLSANGTGTLPGSAFAVQLNNPSGVVANGAGRLIVLDSGNNRAFSDDRGSVSYNFGRTNPASSSPTLQIQETSTGSASTILGSPLFTTSGTSAPFTLTASGSNGCTAGETLAAGVSCLLSGQFNPTALGAVSATYTETGTNTINVPVPFIQFTGTGAVLTPTTSATIVTMPASGTPQYSVPFTVTTTITPSSCNTAAPSCFPTGNVTFFADGTQVGLPVAVTAAGTASQSIPGLPVGAHTIVAVYAGDDFYASSSAPSLAIKVAVGTTKTVVSANPAAGPQFADITLTATVTTTVANTFSTGSVNFYAGTTLLGTGTVNAQTGVATLSDLAIPATATTPRISGKSFGLVAGTYALTAVYSGDTNYSTSTSAAFSLVIAPDPTSFTIALLPAATGTAQGSTAQSYGTVTPSNTLSGTMTFACTGLPAASVCTFSPTSLTFNPVAGVPAAQQVQITLWTDVPPGVIPTGTGTSANLTPVHFHQQQRSTQWAALLGWPLLLTSLLGLTAFRRRLRHANLFTMLALFGLLTGGSLVLTGCGGTTTSSKAAALTPTGTYTVQLVVAGPNSTSSTTPITFTVTQGIAGQQ